MHPEIWYVNWELFLNFLATISVFETSYATCKIVCNIYFLLKQTDNMTGWLFLGSKCRGSNANKSCCTSSSPCKEDEGDCDYDSHCEGGLVCGNDNCPSGFPDSSYDCCEKPSGLLYFNKKNQDFRCALK